MLNEYDRHTKKEWNLKKEGMLNVISFLSWEKTIEYECKAAQFIGSMFLGYAKSSGYRMVNLGKYDSRNIEEVAF